MFPQLFPFLRGAALHAAAASLLVAGLGASDRARAQGGPPSSSFSVGLGVMSRQLPYTGIDRDNKVLPLLQYENAYVHLFGPHLALKLPSLPAGDGQALQLSLVARYDGSGYKSGDAPILEGMARRKGGVWAGGRLEWKSDLVDISAEWLADASGNSKGQRLGVGLERTWRIGEHVMLTPRVGVNWFDSKYVDYHFGVRPDEARPGRAAYVGQSGASAEAGVRAMYLFDRHSAVFTDVEVSGLPSAVKDSPLVNRSTGNRVSLGYLYRF